MSSSSPANPKPPTAIKDPATATKRLSNLSSPSKAPFARSNSTSAHARRLSNVNPTKSNSQTNSSDELERERAKIASLKALITAAEEREADSNAECAKWRTKVNELSSTIDRMEADLVDAQDTKSQYERVTKELEKLKATSKEHERAHLELAEEFESSRAAWVEEEADLRAKLSMTNTQLASLQKEPSNAVDESQDPETPPASSITLGVATSSMNQTPSRDDQAAPLKAELQALKEEKAAIQGSMEQALAASESLKAQLADLARVNEQLMDDNESYQILVGERTLMGGFDIKQLLRADDESDAPTRGNLRSSPQSSSTPSLEGVEEEDEEEEEEEDADAEIERAVLESHGNGSRTTGAVEAGIGQTPKPKRMPNRRKEPAGVGLDLAAELAQAEDVEVEGRRKVEFQERKNIKKIAQDKDQEIKTLKDANKALVLYISKILDRIAAHEGFEKVLSSDYAKSPRGQRPQSPPTGTAVGTNGSQNPKAAANPAVKRSSWMQYFTSLRSPPAPSNIKPLRLGTGTSAVPGPSIASAGLSTGWTGVKEQPELEESDDESRARERRLAEMKLHGLSSTGAAITQTESTNNSTIRASRRSTSMYGANSAPLGFGVDANRRNSGGAGKVSLLPTVESSPAPLTQAGLMKRNEEREKESKMNLEKGQASGFTEIEIRGHRMRPSAARQSSAASGAVSPVHNPQTSPNQAGKTSTGIKDLKMTGDLNHSNNSTEAANDNIFARTARRISMMGGGK